MFSILRHLFLLTNNTSEKRFGVVRTTFLRRTKRVEGSSQAWWQVVDELCGDSTLMNSALWRTSQRHHRKQSSGFFVTLRNFFSFLNSRFFLAKPNAANTKRRHTVNHRKGEVRLRCLCHVQSLLLCFVQPTLAQKRLSANWLGRAFRKASSHHISHGTRAHCFCEFSRAFRCRA